MSGREKLVIVSYWRGTSHLENFHRIRNASSPNLLRSGRMISIAVLVFSRTKGDYVQTLSASSCLNLLPLNPCPATFWITICPGTPAFLRHLKFSQIWSRDDFYSFNRMHDVISINPRIQRNSHNNIERKRTARAVETYRLGLASWTVSSCMAAGTAI